MSQSSLPVRRVLSTGMITVRGDLRSPRMQQVLESASLGKIPQTGKFCTDNDRFIAWMSPDELLLIVPGDVVAELAASLSQELVSLPGLAVDVSDARVLFEIVSPAVRDILAKETPADMLPSAFGHNTVRRTRLGQVAVAIWLPKPGQARLVCRTSEASYVEELLNSSCSSAVPGLFLPAGTPF